MKELQSFLGGDYMVGAECKGRGRGYELTYEGTFSKITGDWLEKMQSNVHGVGDTFDEFVNNVTGQNFSFGEYDTILKKYMREGWNIDFYVYGDRLEAYAKRIWSYNNKDDKEEERYGKSSNLKDLMDFMFHNYDKNDSYVLEKTKEREEIKSILRPST